MHGQDCKTEGCDLHRFGRFNGLLAYKMKIKWLAVPPGSIISYTTSGEWNMPYIRHNQLTFGQVGCELVETYICHIPRHPGGITVLSYDLYLFIGFVQNYSP